MGEGRTNLLGHNSKTYQDNQLNLADARSISAESGNGVSTFVSDNREMQEFSDER